MEASYIANQHMSTRCPPLETAEMAILMSERCTASWGANWKVDKPVSGHYKYVIRECDKRAERPPRSCLDLSVDRHLIVSFVCVGCR